MLQHKEIVDLLRQKHSAINWPIHLWTFTESFI